MTERRLTSKNPDIIASLKALRRAARRALEIGLSTGTPVYVMKDGQIVDLTQEYAGDPHGRTPLAVREGREAYQVGKKRRHG